jgi:hypothetical protein
MNASFRHGNNRHVALSGPAHAALPFVALVLVLVAGASSTLLPAGLAFALATACTAIGSVRVLVAYRDQLVEKRAAEARR